MALPQKVKLKHYRIRHFIGFCVVLAVGFYAALAFSQEKTDIYAELMLWVFKPCAEVGAAAAVKAIKEAVSEKEMKFLHQTTAEISLIRMESLAREMATKIRRSGASWQKRRETYPLILKTCVEGTDSWPK